MKKLLLLIALALLSWSTMLLPVQATTWIDYDSSPDSDSGIEVNVGTGTDDTSFKSIYGNLQEDVADESTKVEEGAASIKLPSFSSEDNPQEGAVILADTLIRFLDFLKLLITPVAMIFITIMGVRMVSAGNENEQVTTDSKNYIKYALEGLIVIFLADSIVTNFFGSEGEIFRSGESGAMEFGRKASSLFTGIYNLVEVMIGAIAVFVLVMSGMRYVAGSYSDDQVGKAKKHITWALVGLFVIGVSEFVVKKVLFQNQGLKLGLDEAKQLFVQVTNFAAGTVGTLSFIFMLYAGYLYVLGFQNEDNVAKAKKIIYGAVVGIILALAAFAITSTVVALDASR